MPFKIFEVGLQTPLSLQTPYIAYGEGKKFKIWILFLQWTKCIPINLKGTLKTFNGNFEGFFTYPTAAKCEEIAISDQKTAIWDLKRDHGVCRIHPIFV